VTVHLVVVMSAISSEFMAFLNTVDLPRKRCGRSSERSGTSFLAPLSSQERGVLGKGGLSFRAQRGLHTVVCLWHHPSCVGSFMQAECEADLIGFEVGPHVKHIPSEGIASFMRRAVTLATQKMKTLLAQDLACQSSGPSGGSERDSVVNLVHAVRESDAKVHIELAETVPKITFTDLFSKCFPETKPTDELAMLVEKVSLCFLTSLDSHNVEPTAACRKGRRTSSGLSHTWNSGSLCQIGRRRRHVGL
jgi:hypothetical protein